MHKRTLPKKLLVTGGAGFIGSSFIRFSLTQMPEVEKIVNLDLLTYAANLKNLTGIDEDPRYVFVRGNILHGALIEEIIRVHHIDTIVHFAAETHVDRSIHDPRKFNEVNVGGTLSLLEVVRRFPHIHFHHVSTDEVYGSIEQGVFDENSPLKPNSPYSASKAASDHFVRAYANTYQLSTTLSRCSNNYGPCQFPEKFIPRMLYGCLHKQRLPVYGQGKNVRDWLYVDDHAEAIWCILEKAPKGEVYNIAGDAEKTNLDLLHQLIEIVAELKNEDPLSYKQTIAFVNDRPGHDFRYGLSSKKIEKELGWKPQHHFESGIRETIQWYLEHPERLQLV